VYGLRCVSEHRPEHAWRIAEPSLGSPDAPLKTASAPPQRPSWLLATPEPLERRQGRPQRHGALQLLGGPERIESGWWDGADVRRDYYRARDSHGSLLWIYRDDAGQWFLHGVFG
jgi:protein ImuB